MGEYTHIDILLGSHLSPRAIQTRLMPRLGSFVGVIEEELAFAMNNDFPTCKGASPTFFLLITNYLERFRRSMGDNGPE